MVSPRTGARARAAAVRRWMAAGLFLVAGAAPSSAAVLSGGMRLQSGGGYDSNVLERLDRSQRVSDAFLRLQAEGRLSSRSLPLGVRAEAVGRALVEGYDRRPEERRRQAEILLSLARIQTGGARRIQVEGGIRGRDYPDSSLRNHRRSWGRLLGALPVGPRGQLVGRADLWSLDFRSTRRRDRTGGAIDLSYESPVGNRFVATGGLELGGARHGVASIQLEPDDGSGQGEHLASGPDREDRSRFAHLGLRRPGRVLFRLQYGFRAQSSNSIDGEYRRHEISWVVSGALPWALHAQCYGNRGHTSYTNEALDRYLVLRVGEVEAGDDDNTIALRLTRRLGSAWSGEARAAWYRNESLLVGAYYSKTVVTAGLSWEAGNASGF